jgi:two-component system OmpR family sensor kinase
VRLRPWRQWTVRSRIVVSVAALAAVALIAVDLAGILLLRSFSLQRIDE